MALILTRRPGEKIIAETPSGEVIEVTIIGLSGDRVRMAVSAPEHTTIDREEIYERKQMEKARG